MYNKNKKIIYLILSLLILFTSCQKAEYVQNYQHFVDVHFDARKTYLANNGQGIFIAARYNGGPVEWNIHQFKIRVVEGEGKFEFYDTRTGETVLDTLLNVYPELRDTITLFQPVESAPVSFIDLKAEKDEPAAPAGSIKVKIANYAQQLLAFEKLAIRLKVAYYDENWNQVSKEIDYLTGIADNINDATYHLITPDVPEGITDYYYQFILVDESTGETFKNYGGTDYDQTIFMTLYMDPVPEKNVYAVYLAPMIAWGETPFFIKYGEDFYNISAEILSYQ